LVTVIADAIVRALQAGLAAITPVWEP